MSICHTWRYICSTVCVLRGGGWGTRAGRLLVDLVSMLEQNKKKKKKRRERVLFFQAGQCKALSSFRVRKNGILVEKRVSFFKSNEKKKENK